MVGFVVATATLFVLWWYSDRVTAQVQLQREAAEAEHRPFPVVERVELERDRGNVHFYVKNVGRGVATNLYLLIQTELEDSKLEQPLDFEGYSLNPLGNQQRMLLPDKAEMPFCNNQKDVRFALLAEGVGGNKLFRTLGVYCAPGELGMPFELRHTHQVLDFGGNVIDYAEHHKPDLHALLEELWRDIRQRPRPCPPAPGPESASPADSSH